MPDLIGSAKRRRFILVTGMPRSGTTAVGSVLSSGPDAAYFYEPLNPISGLYTVTDWFVFPDGTGARVPVSRLVQQVTSIDLRLRAGLWDADPWHRKMLKRVSGSRTRFSALRCRFDPRVDTVVWKDPAAAFLAPVLATTYDLPTIVTVRSPEAAGASFKRLSWGFEVERLARQLRLLTPGAEYLDADFEDRALLDDPVTNAALLWRLTYGYLAATLPPVVNGSVAWANGRSLVADPATSYSALFSAVGLEMTDRTHQFIEEGYQDRGNEHPDSRRAHDPHRNVARVNDYWRATLTASERASVATLTADVKDQVEGLLDAPL